MLLTGKLGGSNNELTKLNLGHGYLKTLKQDLWSSSLYKPTSVVICLLSEVNYPASPPSTHAPYAGPDLDEDRP
jgi:hypothetical protein